MRPLPMNWRTPVCERLACDHPILLAGLGGVARAELVAAVSEAGGFGFLGMVRESPRLIRSEIAAVRARTRRSFGVNLIPAATDEDLFEAELQACLQAGVHAVALFWDLRADVVRRLRDAGILAVCQVGSVDEARAAEDAGADILVAQGLEAGGHVRGETRLADLLDAVLPVVDAPVLAAGGLVDGHDVADVLRRGAQGAVLGTAFLATQESFAHPYHKQRILEADGETVHTRAFHINWPAGAAVRVLPNSVTRGERGDPFASPRQVIGMDGRRPIHLFSTDSPLRSMTGDLEAMALSAGCGAARLSSLPPAGERLRTIVAEARADLAGASPTSSTEPSSPVCYAADAPAAYMGFADAAELVAELTVLLEAERAGARVGAALAAEAAGTRFEPLARAVHGDEIRWCRALIDALRALGATPSNAVGDFFEKAMAIDGLEARLAFVNRGQAWVVRRLEKLLPRVRDDRLHRVLAEMRRAHQANIAWVTAELEEPQD